MPFETYYEHGALNKEHSETHRQILRAFLQHGAKYITPSMNSSELATEFPLDLPSRISLRKAFDGLHNLGFIEKVPHIKRSYRIPPHLVKEVGKFVGKPRK